VLHVNPQVVPLQVAVPFAGAAHAVHELIPQEAGLEFGVHCPEQMCIPGSHEQAFVLGMHAPAHSFMFAGQVGRHDVPLQVTLPPVGAWQGEHAVPQVATSLSETQLPAQTCVPIGQPPEPPAPAALPATPVIPPALPSVPAAPTALPASRPPAPAVPLAPASPAASTPLSTTPPSPGPTAPPRPPVDPMLPPMPPPRPPLAPARPPAPPSVAPSSEASRGSTRPSAHASNCTPSSITTNPSIRRELNMCR
jgi:hypothetical protein